MPARSISSVRVVVSGDVTDRAVAALRDSGINAIAGTPTLVPDARGVAAIAATRWTRGVSLESLQPIYLRPPDAKVPRNGGRLRP